MAICVIKNAKFILDKSIKDNNGDMIVSEEKCKSESIIIWFLLFSLCENNSIKCCAWLGNSGYSCMVLNDC